MSVEERVREALATRAGLITADRLQPAMPPTMATSRPVRGMRWLPILAAAAAAVAILFTVILLVHPGVEVPAGPATPSPASPAPQPGKKGPPVTPSGKAPQPGTTPVKPGPGAPAPGVSPPGGSPAAGSPAGGSGPGSVAPPGGR
jgi:hypothetical protein